MLYIDKTLWYRLRSDLTLNKSKELNLLLSQIIGQKKKKTIVGCIYKHPNVPVGEFINDLLEPLLEKFSFKKSKLFLLETSI